MLDADDPAVKRTVVVVEGRPRGGVSVTLPFDPGGVWGDLDAFYVHGSLGGHPYRGKLAGVAGSWRLDLGPSWCRSPGFGPGDAVDLVMAPEGPRSTTMGADVASAFRAHVEAARFFDSMATFYRNNAARSVDAAKRPETRARRIAEIVERARQRRLEG